MRNRKKSRNLRKNLGDLRFEQGSQEIFDLDFDLGFQECFDLGFQICFDLKGRRSLGTPFWGLLYPSPLISGHRRERFNSEKRTKKGLQGFTLAPSLLQVYLRASTLISMHTMQSTQTMQ